MLDLNTLTWLTSPEGRTVLQDLAEQPLTDANRLLILTRLRKKLSPERAGAALELVLLRRRAEAKFSRAGEMFFTREALEQASGEEVARHRARRFRGHETVLDLGCGIGGDALALAGSAQGAPGTPPRVIAIDRDELRLRLARLNAEVHGVADRVELICADYTQMPLPPADAVFLDPSRRSGGERVFSIHDYTPPLTILGDLLAHYPNVAAKVAPGVKYEELAGLGLAPGEGSEVEIVSLRGDCKEATLWLGGFRQVAHRATMLPSGDEMTDHDPVEPVPVQIPGQFLYEPDCAVIRAVLVAHLATRFGLAQLDPQIAYLTGDEPTASLEPYATCYTVVDSFPFNLKELNRRLREAGAGRVTVKKRGSPIEPEQLQRQLKLKGGAELVVVLTRVRGEPYVVICR